MVFPEYGLGKWELAILMYLSQNIDKGGQKYWDIVKTLCNCKGPKNCKEYKESCRVAVTYNLKKLRKKGLVYKKRYLGHIYYYLTRDGKKLLLELGGKL